MRIAIYVHDLRASGVVRAMMTLARFLAEQGDDAVLVVGSRTGVLDTTDLLPARLVAATPARESALSQLQVVEPLRRTLRELAPDVILSGGNHGHVSVWAASSGLQIPRIFTFSNPMRRRKQPLRNAWRFVKARGLIAASARSIVASRSVATDPAFLPGIAQGRVVMIRNGIDLAAARRPGPYPVPEPMCSPEPTILTIGRWHPQKNLEGLIDAVAHANRVRRLRLVILGDGDAVYGAALRHRAKGHGIGERVIFAGVTDDVYPWLRAADVFAMASWWEAASLALFEALAAGVPIVASTTAGDARDVLEDGRYGLLADPGDPAAFGEALLRQIGEEAVLPGDRAECFDAETMMSAYRDLLKAVCTSRCANGATPEARDAAIGRHRIDADPA